MLTFGFIFWLLMFFWLMWGLWGWWNPGQPNWIWGNTGFLFLLFLLIGWKTFGAPVHP